MNGSATSRKGSKHAQRKDEPLESTSRIGPVAGPGVDLDSRKKEGTIRKTSNTPLKAYEGNPMPIVQLRQFGLLVLPFNELQHHLNCSCLPWYDTLQRTFLEHAQKTRLFRGPATPRGVVFDTVRTHRLSTQLSSSVSTTGLPSGGEEPKGCEEPSSEPQGLKRNQPALNPTKAMVSLGGFIPEIRLNQRKSEVSVHFGWSTRVPRFSPTPT